MILFSKTEKNVPSKLKVEYDTILVYTIFV